jgi:hypothetical protein
LNLRELVGVSLNSGHLEHKEHAEMPIDRIGALAKASALGRSLYHWAYAGDESSLRSAYHHLCRKARNRTRIFRHHKDYKLLEKIVAMCLHEWRYPACQTCGGRGELEAEKLRIVCERCGGTGLHRYSDVSRMEFLKLDTSAYRNWERHINSVVACLTTEDVDATRVCRMNLERV